MYESIARARRSDPLPSQVQAVGSLPGTVRVCRCYKVIKTINDNRCGHLDNLKTDSHHLEDCRIERRQYAVQVLVHLWRRISVVHRQPGLNRSHSKPHS